MSIVLIFCINLFNFSINKDSIKLKDKHPFLLINKSQVEKIRVELGKSTWKLKSWEKLKKMLMII